MSSTKDFPKWYKEYKVGQLRKQMEETRKYILENIHPQSIPKTHKGIIELTTLINNYKHNYNV